MAERKTVCVACISTNNANKSIKENLDSTVSLIESSVKNGAKLVLLPELMATEYKIATSAWDGGETLNEGYTLSFLSAQSKKYSIYIGTSFFEVDGIHFYNTFIMTDPSGELIGKIRKEKPAGPEAFLYSGYTNKHTIHTKDLDTIMVGICYENHTAKFENELIQYQNDNNKDNISMILQPHSCPYMVPLFGATEEVCAAFNDNADNVSVRYATKYKIPVLFCNKVGEYRNPFKPMCMGGWTKIVDGDANIVAKSNNFGADTKPRHDVIVGDVNININGNNDNYEYVSGHWSSCVNIHVLGKSFTIPYFLQQYIGYLFYQLSITRRRKASKISGFNWIPSYNAHVMWLSAVTYMIYRKYQS